jgi:hypothetical protein
VGTEDFLHRHCRAFFSAPGSPFQQFISYGPLGFTYLDRPKAPFPEVLGSDGVFDNLYLEEAWMEGWMGI